MSHWRGPEGSSEKEAPKHSWEGRRTLETAELAVHEGCAPGAPTGLSKNNDVASPKCWAARRFAGARMTDAGPQLSQWVMGVRGNVSPFEIPPSHSVLCLLVFLGKQIRITMRVGTGL